MTQDDLINALVQADGDVWDMVAAVTEGERA